MPRGTFTQISANIAFPEVCALKVGGHISCWAGLLHNAYFATPIGAVGNAGAFPGPTYLLNPGVTFHVPEQEALN